MKLLAVAPDEFRKPYFFQNAYNDLMIWAFSKLRDSRTTAIEFPDEKNMNQGIFIDIFPLDDAPSSNDSVLFEIQKEIWLTIVQPQQMLHELTKPNPPFLLESDIVLGLLNLEVRQRMAEFEAFNLTHFGKSENVNFITDETLSLSPSKKRAYYSEIIYLPFENIYIPAPKEYEKILTIQYGNWHKPVQGTSSHEGIIFDPDVPYTQYL